MIPSQYRRYIQNVIRQCDYAEAYTQSDFLDLINQIHKIREIGVTISDFGVMNYASKIPNYSSDQYKLDFIGKLTWVFLTRISWRPLISNKESTRQRRYIIEVKIFLHGIDEKLRKDGH